MDILLNARQYNTGQLLTVEFVNMVLGWPKWLFCSSYIIANDWSQFLHLSGMESSSGSERKILVT